MNYYENITFYLTRADRYTTLYIYCEHSYFAAFMTASHVLAHISLILLFRLITQQHTFRKMKRQQERNIPMSRYMTPDQL